MQGGVHSGVRPLWHCRLLHYHTGQDLSSAVWRNETPLPTALQAGIQEVVNVPTRSTLDRGGTTAQMSAGEELIP